MIYRDPTTMLGRPQAKVGQGAVDKLRQETDADGPAIEALYDLCFSPQRHSLSSYQFRTGVHPIADLCQVAHDPSGALVGAIRYWPVTVGQKAALLLGPIAVHPDRQGTGVGRLLIGQTVPQAQSLGWARIMLVGDQPYYGRFGFAVLPGVVMPAPTDPARVLGFTRDTDAWSGVAGTVRKVTPGL